MVGRPSEPLLADRDRPAEVIAAVVDLIHESGQPRVTMAAVSARAGVALKTIYREFESQDRLVASALADWHTRVLEHALEDATGTVEKRAARYLVRSTTMFATDIGMARLLIHLAAATSPDVIALLHAMQLRAEVRLGEYLADVVPPENHAPVITVLHALKTQAATEVARETATLADIEASLCSAVALVFRERAGSAGTGECPSVPHGG